MIKKINHWYRIAIPVIFLLAGLYSFPSMISIFLIILAVLIFSIPQLQTQTNQIFPNRIIKVGIVSILLVTLMLTMSKASPTLDTINSKNIATSVSPQSSQSSESNIQQTSKSSDNKFLLEEGSNNLILHDSFFEVHFIDVGQGDASLIKCDGQYMLIDGGKVSDSDLIYSYLKKQNVTHLNYIICTHAHEDHVGGLPGALNYAVVDKVYAPVTSADNVSFTNFIKYLDKQNVKITVPNAGDEFSLGSAGIKILAPIHTTNNTNNTSIVLQIKYQNISFLFTGDAEKDEEQDILNNGYDLESTFLKVGHHGIETSTTYPFLSAVNPQYAVISVGNDNSYSAPSNETLSLLKDKGVAVYRTDLQGDIICISDGNTVSVNVEKNKNVDTLGFAVSTSTPLKSPNPTTEPSKDTQVKPSTTPVELDYIVNVNTMKFHYPNCSSVMDMKESNKWYFHGSRDEVIAKGYVPCKRCNP